MKASLQEKLDLSHQEEHDLQIREHDILDGDFLTHEEIFAHVNPSVSQKFSKITKENRQKNTTAY